ncbi:MAG: DUF3127 domain-containing protein [Bacteroidetes bacterium]|nr:MAG: DUF3127 domain-containing protein [Bacteroidota bacterium]TNE97091.1 MAG: DUF3127 domain-containing protein [Bacteroidota bacterium]
MFKLQGTLKVVKDTQQITDTFSKREFVVTESSSMYPQDVLFQATQDKCSMLDGMSQGDTVEVSFNIRGREWTSPQGEVKYFNSLDAWRIEKVNQGMPQGGPSDMDFGTSAPEIPSSATEASDDDDLPF